MDRNSKGIWLSVPWRKLSFFQVIFFSIFSILFISSSIQIVLFNQGVDRSLNRWEKDRHKRLERIGLDYILKAKEPKIEEPVTIYDKNKVPLFPNRRGMRMVRDSGMFPLKDKEGNIVGYISTRILPFKEVDENRKLINSLLHNLILSSLISLVLSLLLSFFLSKKISKSTIKIREALSNIKNIEKHNFEVSGPKEIVEIGKGVKELALKLETEESLRIQWLHDIAHDLKTPVTALKTQFESMIYGILPIDKDRIEKNNKEVLRLETLIMSMNELMKVETPDLALEKEEIKVKSLFNDLKERYIGLNSGKSVNFSSQEGSSLKGDRSLVFKSVSNLLDNAVKYSYDNTKIECIYSNNQIIVSNKGDKINDKDIKHIFDRLYRGDSSRNSEGSGLGLSIVKAIVEKHKWDIEVISNNGINSFIIKVI